MNTKPVGLIIVGGDEVGVGRLKYCRARNNGEEEKT